MSHFTVLVIGKDVEKALAPYQENNMGDCPKEYLEFVDVEQEYLDEYENEGTEVVIMPDATVKNRYSSEFIGGIPEGSEIRQMRFNEVCKTFEEFVSQYHGEDVRDPEKNRFGYWENPSAKWDWYSVGGRWSGFFKLKEDRIGILGKRSLMDKSEDTRDGFGDVVYKGDIDFESMISEAKDKAAMRYDKTMEIYGDSPIVTPWSVFVADLNANKITIEQAKDMYNAQPRVSLYNEWKERNSEEASELFDWGVDHEEFNVSREKYLEIECNKVFMTFAVVKDGRWYEKGSMGWWGAVSDEKGDEEWQEQFTKLVMELPDSAILTVVDCHI